MRHETIVINDRAKLVTYCLDNDAELYIKSRPAVLIYPGGGYVFCSAREAEQVALAFNNAGFNAFVCFYTTQQGFEEAFKDGSAAFKYVYERKEEFEINKLLVCGFSAGAHMAACVSNMLEEKPDGSILVYPPLFKKDWKQMCPDAADVINMINEKTPKAFIVHAFNDPIVPVYNAYTLMEKMHKAGVEFEAHVFRSGGHGFSVSDKPVSQGEEAYFNDRKHSWVDLCISWIKEGIGDIEFIPKEQLSVEAAPKILQRPFKEFFDNKEAMEIIEKRFPGLYDEVKGKPTEGFPLAGDIIYTRHVSLFGLEMLANDLKKVVKE